MSNNTLPSNIDAEQAVIGAILNNNKVLDDIILKLNAADFYFQKHNIIISCIFDMYARDINIDIVTLSEELNKKNKLDETGGITYISELMSSFAVTENVKSYALIIKEKADKRKIISAAQEMLMKAYEDGSEVKNIINNAEDSIYQINLNRTDKVTKISDCVENAINNIEKLYSNGGGTIGIPTQYEKIDKHLNGLQKGDSIIIAARPSMGKTAFALNIAANISKNNKVAIFSLEMSKEQLTQRMISSISLIEFERVRNGKLEENEWGKLGEYSSRLASRHINIDDTASITVNEIKAKCKKMKIKEGLDVVIIDYLQLIEESNKKESREQEISSISRSLKKIAKELEVTVIALSQLSRAPEQRNDHRPMLSDLRDSGSIEQDADIVMFLYRDEYYNAETEEKNIAECIIAKSRNGKVGTTKLAWLGQYQKFADLDTFNKK